MKSSAAKRRRSRIADKRSSADQIDFDRLVRNLESAMDAAGLNPYSTAKAAGVGKTFITDLIRRKNLNPSLTKLQKVADALGRNVFDLTGIGGQIIPVSGRPIPIIGIVEAGAFRAMPEIRPEREDELRSIIAGRHWSFPNARHFGLEVRGDSMNAAKPTPILHGSIVLCVDMIDAELTIESGRIYAVRRTLDGGQTYEHTIKRAYVFRDRVELRPESTNPAHQTIVIPRGPGDEASGKEVAAIGLVYGVFSAIEA